MSTPDRDIAMQLLGEEERFGYIVRVYGSAAHQQRDGRPKGKIIRNILSETEAQ